MLVELSTVRPKYSLTCANFMGFFSATNMRVLWPHVLVICPDYVKKLTRQRLLDAQGISNLPKWGELKTLAPLEFSVNHM